MTTSTADAGAWERLGAMLVQRRTALDPRFRNRRAFCDATRLDYRLIYDIEEHRRTNFGSATLAAIEGAYQIAPGGIGRFLAGGELEPLPQTPEQIPSARRQRRLRALEDSDPEGLTPHIQDVRRELYAAAGIIGMFPPGADLPGPEDLPELVPLLDALPGDVAFPDSTTEPAVWETRDRLSVPERIRLVARIRHMAAKHAGGQRDRRVSGLTPWHGNGAAGAVPVARHQAGIT